MLTLNIPKPENLDGAACSMKGDDLTGNHKEEEIFFPKLPINHPTPHVFVWLNRFARKPNN